MSVFNTNSANFLQLGKLIQFKVTQFKPTWLTRTPMAKKPATPAPNSQVNAAGDSVTISQANKNTAPLSTEFTRPTSFVPIPVARPVGIFTPHRYFIQAGPQNAGGRLLSGRAMGVIPHFARIRQNPATPLLSQQALYLKYSKMPTKKPAPPLPATKPSEALAETQQKQEFSFPSAQDFEGLIQKRQKAEPLPPHAEELAMGEQLQATQQQIFSYPGITPF